MPFLNVLWRGESCVTLLRNTSKIVDEYYDIKKQHRTEIDGRNLVIRAYNQLTTKVFAQKCQTKIDQPYDQPSFLAHFSEQFGCNMVVRTLRPTYDCQNRDSDCTLRPQ